MLTTSTTRVLGPADLRDALALLGEDPVANAFVTARVLASGLRPPIWAARCGATTAGDA